MSQANDLIPWSRYPELTKERLATLASVIRGARESAVLRHDPSAGDGPWGLGCCAYERMCFAIEKASQAHSWLKVLPDPEKQLRFTFAVGHIPFRIYRGQPGEPPSRYLTTSYAEIRHRQRALEFGHPIPIDGILRIAVETDDTGRASTISVVEMDEERQITGSYIIPSETQPGVIPLRLKPIDTAPPKLEPLKKTEESSERKEQGDASGQ